MLPSREARPARLAVPVVLGALLSVLAVALGLRVAETSAPADVTAAVGAVTPDLSDNRSLQARLKRLERVRQVPVSRSARRVTLVPRVTERLYATEDLTVRTGPGERFAADGEVEATDQIGLTGQRVGPWVETILAPGRVRWVSGEDLSAEKPISGPEAVAGLAAAGCPHGSSIESGLTDAADRVYRAVCAAFPQPTTYGGRDGHGEHVDGRAIDIMVSGSLGYAIAEWLRANAGTLQIRDIIYAQRIWTPDRSGEGWRSMSDRGSTTANHYDHVHVAVY